jgi:hypothetical protein
MRRWWMMTLIGVVAIPQLLLSRQLQTRSSLVLRGTIVSASKVFENPDAPSIDDRNRFEAVDGMFGAGAEYRFILPEHSIFFSLSVDYASKVSSKDQSIALNGDIRRVPIDQGIHFVPIELGVNATVPLSGDELYLTMGGGAGIYFAQRVFTVAGVRSKPESLPYGYGIHIESGLEYKLTKGLWMRAEMRFRDPEVRSNNRFEQGTIEIENTTIPLTQSLMNTKINVHGAAFALGVILDLD